MIIVRRRLKVLSYEFIQFMKKLYYYLVVWLEIYASCLYIVTFLYDVNDVSRTSYVFDVRLIHVSSIWRTFHIRASAMHLTFVSCIWRLERVAVISLLVSFKLIEILFHTLYQCICLDNPSIDISKRLLVFKEMSFQLYFIIFDSLTFSIGLRHFYLYFIG